jgi:hypothetical protein
MTLVEERKPDGPLEFVRKMLNGDYTYLTYFVLSSTCFFFWLTPNVHKLRSLFYSKIEYTVPTQGRRYHA